MFNLSFIFMALVPFGVAALSLISWKLLSMWKPAYIPFIRRNSMSTSIVFIFLIYPNIVNYSFSMLNCIEIDGVTYLKRDFELVCWSGTHIRNILIFALPVFVVWVFGFPLIVFRALYKNKDKLNEKDMLIKYGLYYVGLSDKGYYWEVVVVNLRKVLFVGIIVTLSK